MRNRFLAATLATTLVTGMAPISGSLQAQTLNPPCSYPAIERVCAALASASWACPLSLEAIGGRRTVDLHQRLVALAQAKNSPPQSEADLVEARAISCGLGAVGDTDTARILLQNTAVGLHRTFAQRPQASTLLTEFGNLIVVQLDLGFRTDALYSVALFDELSGRAKPLRPLIQAHITLAEQLSLRGDLALADRYFLSAETLGTVMPPSREDPHPALTILLAISDAQMRSGLRDRAAHNLNRLEASLPYAVIEPSARATLEQEIAARRAYLR